MKKLFLLFCLMGGLFVTTATAQHACGGAKAKAEKVRVTPEFQEAAARAAALDENIEARKDAETGEVSYVRKTVCPASGKVSYAAVQYCNKSEAFVPAKLVGNAGQGNGQGKGAACCAKGTKVAGKSCCSAAQQAACSKAKNKTAKKINLKKSGA